MTTLARDLLPLERVVSPVKLPPSSPPSINAELETQEELVQDDEEDLEFDDDDEPAEANAEEDGLEWDDFADLSSGGEQEAGAEEEGRLEWSDEEEEEDDELSWGGSTGVCGDDLSMGSGGAEAEERGEWRPSSPVSSPLDDALEDEADDELEDAFDDGGSGDDLNFSDDGDVAEVTDGVSQLGV